MGKEKGIFELIEKRLKSSGIKYQSVTFNNKGHVHIWLKEPVEIRFVIDDKKNIIVSSSLFNDLLKIVDEKNYTVSIDNIHFDPRK